MGAGRGRLSERRKKWDRSHFVCMHAWGQKPPTHLSSHDNCIADLSPAPVLVGLQASAQSPTAQKPAARECECHIPARLTHHCAQ